MKPLEVKMWMGAGAVWCFKLCQDAFLCSMFCRHLRALCQPPERTATSRCKPADASYAAAGLSTAVMRCDGVLTCNLCGTVKHPCLPCHLGRGARACSALSCRHIRHMLRLPLAMQAGAPEPLLPCAAAPPHHLKRLWLVLQAAAPGSLLLCPAGMTMWQPRQPGCCCVCGRQGQHARVPAQVTHLRWTLQPWPFVKTGPLPGALRQAF